MDELAPRLRAVADLSIPEVREFAGRHEYDGTVQDLSPEGVRDGLARVAAAKAAGPALDDGQDEAHLSAFEEHVRVVFERLELHRVNPLLHLENLDLAGYDREYGPAERRAAAARAHLAGWPEAVEGAIAALDRVSAPVAAALLRPARGLAAGIPADADEDLRVAALAAHERLLAHLAAAAEDGGPRAALGLDALAALMGTVETVTVDIGALAARADAERDRLTERLVESCARIDPEVPALDLVRRLVREHPDADGVLEAARGWTERAIAFTRDRDLVPYHDGECRVGVAPESRRWAMAMMSGAAPGEPDGPSWYHITPPDPSWSAAEAEEWLEVFSDTTLPGITVHEVAPGHFSHFRALRRAASPVRRTLFSLAFIEGWAHYAEELCVEEGFCAEDPRQATLFEIGVWVEGLIRVTRLACAIGVHGGEMSVADATRRFTADTHLAGTAAEAEARRALFDPTYGRYTWGKLEIMALRERARTAWGSGFSLARFHRALLDLGSPPLGLIGTAIERG